MGGSMRSMEFLIVGEGPLAVAVMELLVTRGHSIVAVVTRSDEVRGSSASHGLRVMSFAEARAPGLQLGHDVLLNIVNYRRIPEHIRSATRIVALNYHDSLLPRHAGFNATTWAIYNDDIEHGVTWHVLTDAIDSGPIVEQVSLPIGIDDDALALDARCFEAGLSSFATVLKRIEQNTLDQRDQDLSRRTFMPLQALPPNSDWLDWHQDAASISRLVRALQTGSGRARLGPAIARSGGSIFVALDPRIVPGVTGADPGRILEVSADEVTIAARSGAVRLRLVGPPTSFDGPCPHGLGVGGFLDSPPQGVSRSNQGYAETASRRALEQFRNMTASRYDDFARGAMISSRLELHADLAEAITRLGWEPSPLLAVAWCCVLENLGLPMPELWRRHNAEGTGLAHAPVTLELNGATSVRRAVDMFRFRVASTEAPILRNALWRDPELRFRAGRRPRWVIATDAQVLDDMPRPPGVGIALEPSGSASICFDPQWTTAEEITKHWERVIVWLRGALTDVEQRIGDIECLLPSEVEVAAVLERTSVAGPQDLLTPDLIGERLDAGGKHLAVLSTSFKLTFTDLAEATAALQSVLEVRGVKAGDTVAIQMSRGPWLVPAVLAVMLSGACWVALDSRHPSQRRRQIVRDAGAVLVLVDAPCQDLIPTATIDVRGLGRRHGARPARRRISPDAIAYRIFTSGTTGDPKGIEVSHSALANHMAWMQNRFPLCSGDRVLQRTNPTFDASIWELLAPILDGVTMVLAEGDEHSDPERLAELIAVHRVTTMQCVPTFLELLLGVEGFPARAVALRRVFVGGEEARAVDIRSLQRSAPVEVVNLYGPSEATIDATYYVVRPGSVVGEQIPIGRPIDGMAAAVVDNWGRRRPVGVVGRLVLWGGGLAAYMASEHHGRFYVRAGRREYDTGDLAFIDNAGFLVFAGRWDGQVKVRGHRVELQGIEAAFRRIPELRGAHVFQDQEHLDGALVAVAVANGKVSQTHVRECLGRQLPAMAIPTHILILDRVPMTSHGKLDRRAIVQRVLEGAKLHPQSAAIDPRDGIRSIVAQALGRSSVSFDDNVFDLGGSSFDLVRIKRRVQRELGLSAPIAQYFRARTVGEMAEVVVAGTQTLRTGPSPAASAEPIAVVGLSGRFPGADTVEDLWRRLLAGDELITTSPGEHDAEMPHPVATDVGIARTDVFDPEFFGIASEGAAQLDPQQRAFLEVSWLALENAGVNPATEGHQVGVFASSGYTDRLMRRYAAGEPRPLLGGTLDDFALLTSADKDFMAPRVSYLLGLGGPSITVQTACSSTLVAVHLALQSLRAGECSVAIAGGASIRTSSASRYYFEPGGVASPDGHCRPFSAAAQGTVFSSAAAAVVLRPLSEAKRRGDDILAVILGSSVLNDGGKKQGFSAPSVDGHARTIRAAVAAARVQPSSIRYVEAHGTGTVLGDPIEIAAIAAGLDRNQLGAFDRCLVGSIKGNIGHTDTVAGVASLIKAVLAVQRGMIPPSINIGRLNANLELGGTSLAVVRRRTRWRERVRTAGVSSLGVGGTNAHVVVQSVEAPARAIESQTAGAIVVVSARTAGARDRLVKTTEQLLKKSSAADRQRIVESLRSRRLHLPHRAFWLLGGEAARSSIPGGRLGGPVALLFAGQGGHYGAMGRWLYENDLTYRRAYDEVVKAAAGSAPVPAPGATLTRGDHLAIHLRVFATEYATAVALESWIGKPAVVLGHSLGEIAAATFAGKLTLDDAVRIVTGRGQGVQRAPNGRMLAVHSATSFNDFNVPDGVSLAADNTPNDLVVAGSLYALRRARAQLERIGFLTKLVPGDRAFHTPALASVAQSLRELRVDLSAEPRMHFISACFEVDGEPVNGEYWAEQVTRPVLFRQALMRLASAFPGAVVVEVGPGTALSQFARRSGLKFAVAGSLLGKATRNSAQRDAALSTLGAAWVEGANVDWGAVPPQRTRVHHAGPPYPFESVSVNGVEGTRDGSMVGGAVRPEAQAKATELGWCSVSGNSANANRSVFHHMVGDLSESTGARALACSITQNSASVVVLDFSIAKDTEDPVRVLQRLLDTAEMVRSSGQTVDLVLTGGPAFDVLGEEAVDPVSRMISASVPSLRGAGGFASVHYVDLEPGRTLDSTVLATALVREEPALAIRGHRLWAPVEVPIELETLSATPPRCWLIFGGTGELGDVLSRHLVKRGDRVLVASRQVGHRRAPPEGVVAVSCDVADASEVKKLLVVQAEEGRTITHIVHAAGETWDAAHLEPSRWDPEEAARIARAKVEGTCAIRSAIRGHSSVQQVIMFSSLSTIEGTPQQTAYAAASGFIDGVGSSALTEPVAWLSIGWDVWKGVRFPHGGLPPDVAIAAFDALVGRRGYVRVRATRSPETSVARVETAVDRLGRGSPGIKFHDTSEAGQDPIIEHLRSLVEEVLGVRLTASDSLTSHGSDSFALTRIAARIRDSYGYGVPLRPLLKSDTIAAMAGLIQESSRDRRSS